jgi:hypothetical protein
MRVYSFVSVQHKLGLSPFSYCLTAHNNLITAFRLYRWLKHFLINLAHSHNLLFVLNYPSNCLVPELSLPPWIYTRSLSVLATNSSLVFCPTPSSNTNQHVPFPSTLLLSSKKVSMSPPSLASKTSIPPNFPMTGSSPLCPLSSHGLFMSFGPCYFQSLWRLLT